MFPLAKQKIGGYQFQQNTFYGVKHTGTDYVANKSEYFAPFDGVAKSGSTTGGGIYWQLTRPNGDVLIARHLTGVIKTENVKEGQLVAITGNTGTLTTNPHLHQEVKVNGQLVDPEKYNWQSLMLPISLTVQLVFNNQKYANELTLLGLTRDRMLSLSGGKVLLSYLPVIYTEHQNIPAKVFMDTTGQQDMAVDKDWLIDNVWSLNKTADVVIFIGKPGDWQNSHDNITTFGHYYSELPATFPALIQVVSGETDRSWKYPELPAFVHYVTHEVSHALYQNSGAIDRTHELDYQSVDGLAQGLPSLDYYKIKYQLDHKTSYEENPAVFIKKENDSTIYLNESNVLVPFSASYENFLADFPGAKVITVNPTEFLKFKIANKVVIKDR